ncbi:MAG TPA: AarF/UbiB family protein [Saprospiraceae bacterium]|mgnify:CR=1 FL=1|nr:AarF/UbiB family protein [Saprospiraceae bacterium]HMQ82561.1 AarF/UbiB family protein [Saprospiraceae bacterium]
MNAKKFHSKSWRSRKVYSATLSIMLDYGLLFLGGFIFGKRYVQKRITRLHAKSANRLKNTFLELQGLFVKIGQMVSILSNFLPEEFRKPLEAFQDHAPARPYEEIKQRIKTELGDNPEHIFRSFQENPIASASIGQVHQAKLKDGTQVAVKIQHAHVPLIAEIDLRLFEQIMRLVAFLFKMKGLEHVAAQVRQMIEEELDYEREASNMQLMRAELSHFSDVIIPEVFTEYSSPHVITSRFCEGIKINQIAQLDAWQINREKLARRLLELCSHMILSGGLYHADPHPGNILVNAQGEMVLLDFGAVSKVNPRMKNGLIKLFEAVSKGDPEEIVQALQFMGFVNKSKDSGQFAERLLGAVQDFFQSEVQMNSLNFKDIEIKADMNSLFRFMEVLSVKEMANSFEVPKDYILLNRMILLVAGISTELAPQLNPLDVVRPRLQEYMLGSGRNLPAFFIDFIKNNVTNVLTIPAELRKVLYKARRGELSLTVKYSERTQLFWFHLVQQFIFALLFLGAITLMYLSEQHNSMQWNQRFSIAAVLFFLAWLRAAFLGFRYRR